MARNMLLDIAPASGVPLLDEDMASVAPMLELAYGEDTALKEIKSTVVFADACQALFALPSLADRQCLA